MSVQPPSHPPAQSIQQPIKLYRMALSGHCHRVELFCGLLGLPVTLVDLDLQAGEHKSPAHLARSPFGQVPAIEDGEVTLSDSNAILVYLEGRYAPGQWLPREPLQAAVVQRWLSVAAGPLAFGPAAARIQVLFKRPGSPDEAHARAKALLGVMDQTLAAQPFLAGSQPSLADVANYSYIASAPEGNVSLEPFGHVRAWLARVEALPGFVPMIRSRVGLNA